ncbi:unnamed protein product, partial [Mesorhabditis belari]|uniref:G protein-coupled receptor n=1 Tax=Mesorhabditis belari TaxID=2138241 RepID=A0AAF3EQ69_9BILA
MSISLLAIHGLYRFVKITSKLTYLFDRWSYLSAIVVAHFLSGVLWLLFCQLSMNPSPERNRVSRENLLRKYNVSIENLGYLGPLYMITDENGKTKVLWKNLIGSIGCLSLLGLFYTVVCLFGLKLFLFIRASPVSERTKRMNYQLMRLFLIQAVVPLFFEYLPCFTNVAAGPLGFPYYEEIGYYQPIFVSLYPFIDSTMVFVGFRVG